MDPKALLVHVPRFFTPEECQNIIDMKERLNLEPGLTYSKNDPTHEQHEDRICNLAFIKPVDDFPYIDRIRNLVQEYNKIENYHLNDRLEIQFTEYNKGAWFRRHQDTYLDANHRAMRDETRKISMTIQLSDTNDYTGGDVIVTLAKTKQGSTGRKISREQGDATIFPSYFNHEVNKITSGVRYALVIWQSGPTWR